MPQYRLRTLLIVLALAPPVLAAVAPPLIQWFTPKPPVAVAVAKAPPTAPPYFATYSTGAADPMVVLQVGSALLSGRANFRMSVATQTRSVSVLATRSHHKTIQAIIDDLQQAPPPTTLAELQRFKAKLPSAGE